MDFSLANKANKPCDVCFHAKQICCSFSQSESNASANFELIHCDICGAYRIPSTCGTYYFLSIVDDASRAVWAYLTHEKSEASMLLQNFVIFVKNQFGKDIKVIRSDNGKEFNSRPVQKFYCEKGIIHQTSCVDTL